MAIGYHTGKSLMGLIVYLLSSFCPGTILPGGATGMKLCGDQDGTTPGCSCFCPLTGDLTSSACVCGCGAVNGISATAYIYYQLCVRQNSNAEKS